MKKILYLVCLVVLAGLLSYLFTVSGSERSKSTLSDTNPDYAGHSGLDYPPPRLHGEKDPSVFYPKLTEEDEGGPLNIIFDQLAYGEIEEGFLGGYWYYERHPLGLNRLTWKSEIVLGGEPFLVETAFTDRDSYEEEPLRLAFRVYSPYEANNWLWIEDDGSISVYFNRLIGSEAMQKYPGGYEKFEDDLKSLAINWEALYQKSYMEFLIIYITRIPPENYWIPFNDSEGPIA
jgi:hypothetical protein